jgi:hypothetical protein
LSKELQRIGSAKLRRNKRGKQHFLWNDIPSLGREAMIATIENEFELIKALKAENNQEYDKLHFFKWASRPVYSMDSSKQKSSLSRV